MYTKVSRESAVSAVEVAQTLVKNRRETALENEVSRRLRNPFYRFLYRNKTREEVTAIVLKGSTVTAEWKIGGWGLEIDAAELGSMIKAMPEELGFVLVTKEAWGLINEMRIDAEKVGMVVPFSYIS